MSPLLTRSSHSIASELLYMSIQIRQFKNKDAIKVTNVIKKSFRSIISKNYTKESVEDQIKENSPKKILEKAKKVKYFVAVEKGKILGFGGYNEEKIHTFFVLPEMQGKGIGSKILERVLSEAKREGIKSLKCWATFNAENFYAVFGFKKRKKFTLKTKNSSISFMEMTKKL